MQIVIDVPEEAYNTGQLLHYFGCYSEKLDLVLYSGTPLPEHHGRLIDADKLISDTLNNPLHVPYIYKDDIKYAPTIIEAEGE